MTSTSVSAIPVKTTTEPRRSLLSRLFLPVLFTANFMVILDVFIVNVAAPSFQHELHASASDVQWVIAGYILCYAVGLISGGRLGDVYGRRRVFRIGMLLFTAASAACAAAPSPGVLIVSRLVQGIGGALLMPQVLSIIQVTFTPDERPQKLAAMIGVQGVASVTGQLLGGGLITLNLLALGWRWVFLINVPIGLAAALLVPRVMPESFAENARRLDLKGMGLASLALLLIVGPIVEGRDLGWPLWLDLGLVLAIPTVWAFIALERRVARAGGAPLADLALFRLRGFRYGISSAPLLLFMPAYFLLLALYVQDGEGLTAIKSGLIFSPLAVLFVIASLVGPRVFTPGPRAAAIGTGIGVVGLIASIVVMLATGDTFSAPLVILASLPVGVGMGTAVPMLLGTVLRSVPVSDAGAASGMLNTALQVGNALGVAVIGAIYFGALGAHPASLDDYAGAFATAMVVQVVAVTAAGGLLLRLARLGADEPVADAT